MSEHDQQVTVMRWSEVMVNRYQNLDLLYAIPNGGHRHISVAKKLKAEGVKAGVPDLCLPVPSGEFHGLYIEMKDGAKKKPTKEQSWWCVRLTAAGYKVCICHSATEAIKAIENYYNNGGR